MPFRFAYAVFMLLVLFACGGGGSTDVSETVTIINTPPSQPGEPPEEPPKERPGVDYRTFQLGLGVVQMLEIENRPLRNGNANHPISSAKDEADYIKIVADYNGIPYDVFSTSTEIPEGHAWTIATRELIAEARAAGRPLMLQLGFARESMVGRSVDDNGELLVDLTWAPPCYDLSSPGTSGIGDAYVNYAAWLAREFRPAYVVNFAEANIFYTKCGGATPAWDAVVDIQRRAYEAIKRVDPTIIVFASFNLEALYGGTLQGWDEEQYQGLSAMAYDTFAMASYPFGIRFEDGSFATPYDLPADYLSRVLTFHPDEKRLSIAETGWNNESIAAGDEQQCLENLPYSDPTFARDFLEFTLNSAITHRFQFLTWFSNMDVLPSRVVRSCFVRTDGTDPENDACEDDYWCLAVNQAKNSVAIPGAEALFSEVLLKAFGTMGLKEYDGAVREPLLNRWRQMLALPFRDEPVEVE